MTVVNKLSTFIGLSPANTRSRSLQGPQQTIADGRVRSHPGGTICWQVLGNVGRWR